MVTIDAIGCQKAITRQIVTQQADYILAVKENQPFLLADIKDSFQMLAPIAWMSKSIVATGAWNAAAARCWLT